MNSLFETTSSQSILDRLDKLTPETPAQWGKMDVSQMLKHCQAPLDIALENITLTSKTGWLQKQIMKLF
ncbi:hypothetical protein [Formosa algae]|nr:hypothetical protein [Formosa algae]